MEFSIPLILVIASTVDAVAREGGRENEDERAIRKGFSPNGQDAMRRKGGDEGRTVTNLSPLREKEPRIRSVKRGDEKQRDSPVEGNKLVDPLLFKKKRKEKNEKGRR